MMIHTITIKEISKQEVEVEANSREEVLEKVEKDYWENPNNYVLEPEETIFE